MKYLQVFSEFVAKMQVSNSRCYKWEVLQTYKNEDGVKYLLNFVFSPYIVTGVSRKKLSKDVTPVKVCFSTTVELLEWLKVNNTGRDEAIAKIKGFQLTLPEHLKSLLEDVICKNVQLGVDTPTINKMWPKLVPTFNIMLANKYFDNPDVIEGKEFTLTTKIDGGRIIAIKEDVNIACYTRAGQRYEGLVDIEEAFEFFPNGVYDGEITLLDCEGKNNKEQYKQTMMITRRLGEKHGVKMRVFDYIPLKQFKEEHSITPYAKRRALLDYIMFASKPTKFIELLPALYVGSDKDMIMKILNEQIAKGEEGIMININDAPYTFCRSYALLKVKKMQDVDLVVTSLEEGQGLNKGKLGAFVVDYKGYSVRVGAGISKQIREQVWADKESYIGITISVQYFEETTNQAGGVSLRFPVFIDFRYDK